MKVVVDLERCEAHGQCVLVAPAVFHGFSEEGMLEYDPEAPESERAAVEQAVAICPAAAIRLEEG